MTEKMTDQEAYALLLKPRDEGGRGFTKTQLAEIVGISKQALTRWDAIPLKYVRIIHERTGVARSKLLPSEFS